MTHTLDLAKRSSNASPAAENPTPARPSLVGLGKAELRAALTGIGVAEKAARMRAEQLWRWIYHYGVTDFAAMTNVAKELRADLDRAFTLERPRLSVAQVSVDGTRKWLIDLGPGIEVESVYIPDVGRAGALCVSSQVGCTLTCSFCHTGTQRLVRNLSAREIVAQIMIARDALGEWPTPDRPLNDGDRRLTNIVFMGM
ncbi:MAG: 23S rRNA (adenine(2503)-C(2))-methyltransferase RlmN, partial [Caulobacterales bacterium]